MLIVLHIGLLMISIGINSHVVMVYVLFINSTTLITANKYIELYSCDQIFFNSYLLSVIVIDTLYEF